MAAPLLPGANLANIESVGNVIDRTKLYRAARDISDKTGVPIKQAEQIALQAYTEIIQSGKASEGSVNSYQIEDYAEEVMQAAASGRQTPTAMMAEMESRPNADGQSLNSYSFAAMNGQTPPPTLNFDRNSNLFKDVKDVLLNSGGPLMAENTAMIASGEGRVGRTAIPDAMLNRDFQRPTAYGDSAFADAIGALVWHGLDSASFGLFGLGMKLWGDHDEQVAEVNERLKTTETTAGEVAKWGGTLAGFLVPTGAFGLAAKGATKIGAKGLAAGLGAVDYATHTPKLFKGMSKAFTAAPRVAKIEKAAGELAEIATKKAAERGASAAVAKEAAGIAKGAARKSLLETAMVRKTINPELLKEGATNELKQVLVTDFRKRAAKKMSKEFASDDVAQAVLKDVEAELGTLLEKYPLKSIPEKIYAATSKKWGATVARGVEMMLHDSFAAAVHGTLTRTTHALAEPQMYGHGDLSPFKWDDMKKAMKIGVTGGSDDWSMGAVGDVWYGGVVGSAGLFKMVPILGRRANKSWTKAFKNWVAGPSDHKAIAEYADALGRDVEGELLRVASKIERGSGKKIRNPLSLSKQIAPNLEKATDDELKTVATSYLDFLDRNLDRAFNPDKATLRANLQRLQMATDETERALARKQIASLLGTKTETLLQQYRGRLGRDLLADLSKNIVVGASIAVFGGGKQLMDAYKMGNVSFGNILTHIGFSFMAAQDPFWNAGHAWGGGWLEDRKRWHSKGDLAGDVDANEMRGYMGSQVYMNRLKGQLRALGVIDADFYDGPSQSNKIWTSIARGKEIRETLNEVGQHLGTVGQNIADGDGAKIIGSISAAAKGRQEGVRAMSDLEIAEAITFFKEAEAAGVDLPKELRVNGKKLTDDGVELDLGDEIHSPVFAEAAYKLREILKAKGIIRANQPLSLSALHMMSAQDAVRQGAAIKNGSHEVVSMMQDLQEGHLGVQNADGRDAPLQRVNVVGHSDGSYDADQSRYNSMVSMLNMIGSSTTSDKWATVDVSTEKGRVAIAEMRRTMDHMKTILKTVTGQDVDVDNLDLGEFMADIMGAYSNSVAPTFVALGDRKFAGSRSMAVDFNRTVMGLLMEKGLAQRMPTANGKEQYAIFEPNYKDLNLSETQEQELRALIQLAASRGDIRVIRGRGMEYTDASIKELWSDTRALKHADQAEADFDYKGGLFGVLKAVGLHLDSPGQVDAYLRSMDDFVRGAVSESTRDFVKTILEPNGLIQTDDSGRRMLVGMVKVTHPGGVEEPDFSLDDIKRGFLEQMNGVVVDGLEVNRVFTDEQAEIFARMTKEAIDGGLIDGTSTPDPRMSRTTDTGIEMGPGSRFAVFNGEKGQRLLEHITDALEAYRAAEQEAGMVDVMAKLNTKMAEEYKGAGENETLKLHIMDVHQKLNGLYAAKTPRAWRQLNHVLRNMGLLTIENGNFKISIDTKIDVARTRKVLEFIDTWTGGDAIASYLALTEDSIAAAREVADRHYSRIHVEEPEGAKPERIFKKLAFDSDDARDVAIAAKSVIDASVGDTAGQMRSVLRQIVSGATQVHGKMLDDDGKAVTVQVAGKTYLTNAERDAAMKYVDDLKPHALLSMAHSFRTKRATKVISYGAFGDAPPGSPEGYVGTRMKDVSSFKNANWKEQYESHEYGLVHQLAEEYGHEVAELSSSIHMPDGPRSLFGASDEVRVEFQRLLDDLYLGKYAPLTYDETTGVNTGVRAVAPPSMQPHYVGVVMGDLDRVVLHRLPDLTNAQAFIVRAEALLKPYRNSNIAEVSATVKEVDEFIGIMKQALADNDAEAIWKYASTRQDQMKRLFYLVSYDGLIGTRGGTEALGKMRIADDGYDIINRIHQGYSKGARTGDANIFREAVAIARARSKNNRAKDDYGMDLARGKIRIIVVDDKEAEGNPAVTTVDSHTIIAPHIMEALATMHGYDVSDGGWGQLKASVFQRNGGAAGDSNMLTKTLMSTNPEFEGIMKANGVGMIITKSAAKIMFGDYAKTAVFDTGSIDLDGRNLRDVLAASQSSPAMLQDAGMVHEIDISSIRFQSMPHRKSDRGTVSWQIENWMDQGFTEALVNKYMRGDYVESVFQDMLARHGADSNAVMRFFFDRIDESSAQSTAEAFETSYAKALLRSSNYASPHHLSGRRPTMGVLKRKLHDDMLFKGHSEVGGTSVITPDYHGVLNSGEAMVPHFMRNTLIPRPDDVRIGIKRYSLVEGDNFSMIDDEQARQYSHAFDGRSNHYNSVAEGQEEIKGRRTEFVDYKLFTKGGKDSAVYHALVEAASAKDARGNRLVELFIGADNAKSSKAAELIAEAWTDAASVSDGVGNTEKQRQLVDRALVILGKRSEANLDAITKIINDSAASIWEGAQEGPGVSLGSVMKSLDLMLGQAGGVGYQHSRRLPGQEHGKTPVTYGILGFAQRSPSNRPNDTIPIHMLGFKGEDNGNDFTMGYEDAVKLGEADFDSDKFNYWFDMPDRAAGSIMRIRNISGAVKAPERTKMIHDRFSLLPESSRLNDDHNYRYAREQHKATILRGQLVKAQKSVYNMLLNEMTMSYMKDGVRVVLRPRAVSQQQQDETLRGQSLVDVTLDKFQGSVLDLNTAVQSVIDSKKGMLPPEFASDKFDPMKFVFEKMYEVMEIEDINGQRIERRRDGGLDAREIGMLRVANNPYSQVQRMSGSDYFGDSSRSMSYEQMLQHAMEYASVMDLGNGGKAKKVRMEAYIRHMLGNGYGDSGSFTDAELGSISLGFKDGVETAVDRYVGQTISADKLIYARGNASIYDIFTGSLWEGAKLEATAKIDDTKTENVFTKFYGHKRELDQMIENLLRAYNSGDSSVLPELQYRRAQAQRMQQDLDSGAYWGEQPKKGMEWDLAWDATIGGYAWRSSMQVTPDMAPSDADARMGAAIKIQSNLSDLRRLRHRQLNGLDKPNHTQFVTEEWIDAAISSQVYQAWDAYGKGNEERFIMELIMPRVTGELWRMNGGEQAMRFKNFQSDLLRIAYKIWPDEAKRVMKKLTTHAASWEHIAMGDPAGLMRIRESRLEAENLHANVGFGMRALNRAKGQWNPKAMRIAQDLLLRRHVNKQVLDKMKEQLASEYPDGEVPQELMKHAEAVMNSSAADLTRRLEMFMNHDRIINERIQVNLSLSNIINTPTLPGARDSIDLRDFGIDDATIHASIAYAKGESPYKIGALARIQSQVGKAAAAKGEKASKEQIQIEAEKRFNKMMAMVFEAMESDFKADTGALPKVDLSGTTAGKLAKNNQLRSVCGNGGA